MQLFTFSLKEAVPDPEQRIHVARRCLLVLGVTVTARRLPELAACLFFPSAQHNFTGTAKGKLTATRLGQSQKHQPNKNKDPCKLVLKEPS